MSKCNHPYIKIAKGASGNYATHCLVCMKEEVSRMDAEVVYGIDATMYYKNGGDMLFGEYIRHDGNE